MAQFSVTIDHTKVLADQTDFPVYINLADMPASFWSTVANGGGDIRCYKDDGTTELAREVVSCDTGGDTGELHVKYTGTLSASVDTIILIDVDGIRSDYAVTATYGRNAVWSDYRAVYHLEHTSGNATDSTVSGYTLTNTTSKSYVAGGIGKGIDFGSSVRNTTELTTGSEILTSANGAMSFSVRFKQNTSVQTSGNPGLFILPYKTASGSSTSIIPEWNAGAPRITILRRTSSDVNARTNFGNSTSVYYHVVSVFDGSNLNGYLDGTVFTTSNLASSGTFNASAYPVSLGGSYTSNNATAIIDEVRIRLSALSSTWVSTEYNNQNSPSTFYATAEVFDTVNATTAWIVA